jgi:glutaredoxin
MINSTTIKILGKKDCCLCKTAKFILKKIQRKYIFQLLYEDITEKKELFEKYQNDIPVILLNDVEISKQTINERELREEIKKQATKLKDLF